MTKVRSSTCLRCQCYEGQQGWTGEWQPQTHINNCFNQFISQFVSCERASTDVLRTTSIPLTSSPSTSVTATCWLKTVKPQVLSHADCQVGAFQRLEHCPLCWKTGSLRWFFSRDSILELAKVHARDFPPRRTSVKPGNFQLLWAGKRWSERILQKDLIPIISNFVSICVVVFVFFFLWGQNKCQWSSPSYCRIIQPAREARGPKGPARWER